MTASEKRAVAVAKREQRKNPIAKNVSRRRVFDFKLALQRSQRGNLISSSLPDAAVRSPGSKLRRIRIHIHCSRSRYYLKSEIKGYYISDAVALH